MQRGVPKEGKPASAEIFLAIFVASYNYFVIFVTLQKTAQVGLVEPSFG
jgi:hypothetical protein